MFKATIDGKEVELKPEDLQPAEEGYAIITPDNVPKGYFTQEAVNTLVKENVNKAKGKVKDELLGDQDFHKTVFSKYDVSLDDDGKPKGLKPDFDPDKWKSEQAEKLTKPYKDQIEEAKKRAEQLERGKIEAEILRNANGMFKEEYTKSLTGDDSPWVVDKFSSLFGVDDDNTVALKDGDGFAVDGDGSRITPEKYFKSNEDRFKPYLQDKRQRGSGFNQPGKTNRPGKYSPEEIKKMSDSEYEAYRKEAGFKEDAWS